MGQAEAGSEIPPGPATPSALQAVSILRDPNKFFIDCRRRYGDVFTVRLAGQAPTAFVSSVDLAREVFASDHADGRAGEARGSFLERLVGNHSLLCLDGGEWARQRRNIGSTLSIKAAARHASRIARIADEHIDDWPRGVEFVLHPRMRELSLDILVRVALGIRDPDRAERLRALIPALFADWVTYGMLAVLPGKPGRWLERRLTGWPGSPVARFRDALSELDGILSAEIAERRAAPEGDGSDDALSTLALARDDDGDPLDPSEVRSGLMTLLVAGYETTAAALTWVFERVVRHPAVLAELADADRPYIDAVVRETLSARPIFVAMPRILAGPLELGGYRIPAGWQISPAAPLLHGADVSPASSDEFRPGRLLETGAKNPSWVFGGGRRRCTGSGLAMIEMIVVVERTMKKLRLQAPGDRAPEKMRFRNGALVPARGGRVVAKARSNA